MKINIILMSLISVFIFSGCLQKQPLPNIPDYLAEDVNLPKTITFNNKTYTLNGQDQFLALYSLNNQDDFVNYTEKIIIAHIRPYDSIDNVINFQIYFHSNILEEAKNNILEYEIKKISDNKAIATKIEKATDNKAILTEFDYRINDADFNKIEASLTLFEIKNCGEIRVGYYEIFDKNTDINKIKNEMDSKKAYFLENYPNISCK